MSDTPAALENTTTDTETVVTTPPPRWHTTGTARLIEPAPSQPASAHEERRP
ncbi:hypothetical protein [Streptomyces albidoflavus]|uniref:hypothetical protein n=1 Tax=Streptomyces albidoflavus TaxID=1886 RepID=UPI0013EE903C|nr:hypothetical protein [Streptomyces albidoflavus]